MPTALSTFYPHVLPYAPNAPTPLVRRALLDACIEFCRGSHAVQLIDQQSLRADTQDYDMSLPSGTRLTKVLAVSANDVPLTRTSLEVVNVGTALTGVAVGTAIPAESTLPRAFFQKALNTPTISLWPIPSADLVDGLVSKVAYEPDTVLRSNTTVPDVLYSMFAEDIAHGALYRILRVKGQPYTDIAESDRRGGLFQAAIRNAGVLARSGQVASSARVAMRKFA